MFILYTEFRVSQFDGPTHQTGDITPFYQAPTRRRAMAEEDARMEVPPCPSGLFNLVGVVVEDADEEVCSHLAVLIPR